MNGSIYQRLSFQTLELPMACTFVKFAFSVERNLKSVTWLIHPYNLLEVLLFLMLLLTTVSITHIYIYYVTRWV